PCLFIFSSRIALRSQQKEFHEIKNLCLERLRQFLNALINCVCNHHRLTSVLIKKPSSISLLGYCIQKPVSEETCFVHYYINQIPIYAGDGASGGRVPRSDEGGVSCF